MPSRRPSSVITKVPIARRATMPTAISQAEHKTYARRNQTRNSRRETLGTGFPEYEGRGDGGPHAPEKIIGVI
jgi:hypothetical protein